MYFLNVWIHILAAAVWTGGLIYTAAVVVPFALSHPWKLMLVIVMAGLMAFHDITSIRAAKRYTGSPEGAPGNRMGSRAAALATLVAILVLYISVRLVHG